MNTELTASTLLASEAGGILVRLGQIQPFALHMPGVPAAQVSSGAQSAIEAHIRNGVERLRNQVRHYLTWLQSPEGKMTPISVSQKRFTVIRLQFNALLSQFDIFSDVLTQRAEHRTGVWLAGLDALASDALRLPHPFYRTPYVVTHLERGPGAAIRRARTRLPGGVPNPVAVIRVPRERMVGVGIGSSLIHEVGHQASALLGLAESIRPVLQARQDRSPGEAPAWVLWERWISESLADFWSVGKLGVGSTLGLMGVLSLPKAFVFRTSLDDPHPIPWIRALLSCTLGDALYPHPQWKSLATIWGALYPCGHLGRNKQFLLSLLLRTLPAFGDLLLTHQPPSLRGARLGDLMPTSTRQPAQLTHLFNRSRESTAALSAMPPTLAMAVLGQARANGALRPTAEGPLIADLLEHWALEGAGPPHEA